MSKLSSGTYVSEKEKKCCVRMALTILHAIVVIEVNIYKS